MIRLKDYCVMLNNQGEYVPCEDTRAEAAGRCRTMTYQILKEHNHSGSMDELRLKFDALVSPDNNYVNILQTVRACGIRKFPVPYVLSNCHHSLCAVGGTINEDDHVFGLGSAKKYGGIFVPPYRAVLHQYMRERMAGCGDMILGSDSHTRYGALGTLGIGEGGGEVAKQLLGRTYDLAYPPVIAVYLTGEPRPGVGPQDVALALIAEVFERGFTRNKILEFTGPGIKSLSMEYRMGIDVMTTESGALSSIWVTDEKTEEYLAEHGRAKAYRKMKPAAGACYDGLIEIDLSAAECMIALPFHPGNAVPIREFKGRMGDGGFYVNQALVSGCSGGLFENIVAMADILKGFHIPGDGLNLGINPASLPIMADLMEQGIAGELTVCGAVLRPAICGPCFGVTDVPANNQLSIRHVTRNYPNREGSKPEQGQMAAVCLMDARSIAATVRNGGRLTAATELEVQYRPVHHHFDKTIYENQVFDGFGRDDCESRSSEEEPVMGPNIADWPRMQPLTRHLLLRVAGVFDGSVTTDELIPSGEASSFRSNPEKIAGYTLISRDREYVGRARQIRSLEKERREAAGQTSDSELNALLQSLAEETHSSVADITLGSVIVSSKIGEGSSREQAASCQKVLGGFANIANEYTTKRYRSNLINWGILPLRTEEKPELSVGSCLFIRDVTEAVLNGDHGWIPVEVLEKGIGCEPVPGGKQGGEQSGEQGREQRGEQSGSRRIISCTLDSLTDDEKRILLSGSLINYYKQQT